MVIGDFVGSKARSKSRLGSFEKENVFERKRTFEHTHTHKRKRARTRARAHTHTATPPPPPHTHIRARARARTHTHNKAQLTCRHTHTYTHTRARARAHTRKSLTRRPVEPCGSHQGYEGISVLDEAPFLLTAKFDAQKNK